MFAPPPLEGKPYTSASRDPIDHWSRDVFEALSDWAADHDGRWVRSDDQTLVVEVVSLQGNPIEPVRLYTGGEELTAEFGRWHTHLPELAMDARGAALEAIELVSRWFAKEIRTALYLDDAGCVRGATMIEASVPLPPEPGEVIARLSPTRVEIRSVQPIEPQIFTLPRPSTSAQG